MADIDLQSLISRRIIPRDSNFNHTAPMVGIDPLTGQFVPLKLTTNGDGTYNLAVSLAALPSTVNTLIQGLDADGITHRDLGAYANGDGTYSLKVQDAQLDVPLSTVAKDSTLQSILSILNAGPVSESIASQKDSLAASGAVATTDFYATVQAFNIKGLKTKTLVVQNLGANPIMLRILGSVDNGASYDAIVADDVLVPVGGSAKIIDSDYETDIAVQAKSANAGAPSSVQVKLAAVSI